ncbi:acyclic terpene utilization AtuA family protein [uncultured Sulfitobacter sp.]|uniref:acyclic terpene utilization AtuA family protein n=1 Tax=uncultured Sulfitobacter sp. TaxID=191468 RepID=UPI002595E0C3|nr:acyclic terpene utilization AtuA family protein [uncultured Sulfitobacter sp.]
MMPPVVHISVGAGFANDRRNLGVSAAKALTGMNGPKYLIFECLAERTLAFAQTPEGKARQARRAISFVRPCLKLCVQNNIKIISNFGGSDPDVVGAALAQEFSEEWPGLKIGIVTGDAIDRPKSDAARILSQNAYMGAAGIAAALAQGANLVVAGRVSDPSLAVGPVVHECNLSWTDWDALALATVAGHLIECGTQVCGGYFADPGLKYVPDIAHIGAPVASVDLTNAEVRLTKPNGGGVLNRSTVTEQLLYEIDDPANYKTPDVTMDISAAHVEEISENSVRVSGVRGLPRPETLKALTCIDRGWIGEAGISYLGETSFERAQLARDILIERCRGFGIDDALHCEIFVHSGVGPRQARLRVAIADEDMDLVQTVLDDVESLYLNGPAGGGGIRVQSSPRIETRASYVQHEEVQPVATILGHVA